MEFRKTLLAGLVSIGLAAFAPIGLTGCEDDNDLEDAAEELEEGAEDLGDEIEEGAEDLGDEIEEGVNDAERELEDATD